MISKPKRTQNRLTNEREFPLPENTVFKNEPDTNFDLRQNREWADGIRKNWMKSKEDKPYIIPVQIGNKEVETEKRQVYTDHCQVEDIVVCEVSLSNQEMVEQIVEIAKKNASNWRKTTVEQRNVILHKTADLLNENRGNLIGCMSAITGKTFAEGDVEVSEAVDFCRYYPISMMQFAQTRNSRNDSQRDCARDSTMELPIGYSCGWRSCCISRRKYCDTETCHCGISGSMGICQMFLGIRSTKGCASGSLYRWPWSVELHYHSSIHKTYHSYGWNCYSLPLTRKQSDLSALGRNRW
jgi:7-cyano-7-deazaguanine synthase in queuosine biosynthesis